MTNSKKKKKILPANKDATSLWTTMKQSNWNAHGGSRRQWRFSSVWLQQDVDDMLCAQFVIISGQAGLVLRPRERTVLLRWRIYVNAFCRRRSLPDVMDFFPNDP